MQKSTRMLKTVAILSWLLWPALLLVVSALLLFPELFIANASYHVDFALAAPATFGDWVGTAFGLLLLLALVFGPPLVLTLRWAKRKN